MNAEKFIGLGNQKPRLEEMKRVYLIRNKVNGKHYVGVTTQSVRQRWAEHISRFKRGDRDHKLYLAMRKYGPENFECMVIKTLTNGSIEELKELEMHYIRVYDTLQNGYNMTPGGDVIAILTAKKISDALTGRKHSAEHCRRLWESRKANPNYVSPGEWARQNPNALAKYWRVQHPDGHIEVVHNLNTFCKKYSLSFNLMLAVLKGWQRHHKGFVLLARFIDYPEKEYSQAAGNSAHP